MRAATATTASAMAAHRVRGAEARPRWPFVGSALLVNTKSLGAHCTSATAALGSANDTYLTEAFRCWPIADPSAALRQHLAALAEQRVGFGALVFQQTGLRG